MTLASMAVIVPLALVAAFFVVVLPAAIAFASWQSVTRMAGPDLALVPRHEDEWIMGIAAHFDEWAVRHGYTWLGAHALNVPPHVCVLAWQRSAPSGQRGHPAADHDYFCVYAHALMEEKIDLVTVYGTSPFIMLTTTTTKDAFMFPRRPGVFKQCFPKADLDELADLHAAARRHVEASGVRGVRDSRPFEVLIVDSIRAQMAMVRRIPLWPLRAVWWYASRGAKCNRPVPLRWPAGRMAEDIARATPL